VILNRSGINTKIFGSHSIRSASTSKAKYNAVPIDGILKKAGWSNVKTSLALAFYQGIEYVYVYTYTA
jgi:hypothetical protein